MAKRPTAMKTKIESTSPKAMDQTLAALRRLHRENNLHDFHSRIESHGQTVLFAPEEIYGASASEKQF
jgi:hypothetical protein